MAEASGMVTIVGAGPGDPDLITVKGLDSLRRADVVVHDRLIPEQLLGEVKPGAKVVDVGKVPGSPRCSQDEINTLLIQQAREGKTVVRLKGGDPFVFGRGWEELRACREADVPCAVIPGVSSAFAVPAAADIPVSLRGEGRSLAVVTAQNEDGTGAAGLDYDALARMDTIVVLMGRANLREVAGFLMSAGREAGTPAACIEQGTMPGQRVVVGVLGNIADLADQADLRSPATTVIGQVARHGAATIEQDIHQLTASQVAGSDRAS